MDQPLYVSASPLSSQKKAAQNQMFQKVTINHPFPIVYKPNSSQSVAVLPGGWKREEFVRQNGLSNGKSIIVYISPNGLRIRNPRELQSLLGDRYDVSNFDWKSGKFVGSLSKKQNNEKYDVSSIKKFRGEEGYSLMNRRSLNPLDVRVCLHSTNNDRRFDSKPTIQNFPKQLFSERRLAGMVVDAESNDLLNALNLPTGIIPSGVPYYGKNELIHNIVSFLSSDYTISGQDQSPQSIEKNPCVSITTSQPFIKNYIVTEDDVQRQYSRVKELRSKLEAARKKHAND